MGSVSGKPPSPVSALPPLVACPPSLARRASSTEEVGRRCPSRHFGENQLSPRSLGISPLPTTHPKALQRPQVRPSSPHYRTFSLVMGGSRGFGSTPRHVPGCPSNALFGLAFAPAPHLHVLNLATRSNSPAHSSISTPSPKGSDCLSAHGFRIFSSPFRGAFHLSLTVLVHYRSSRVFRLGGWSPQLPTEFHVLRGTQVPDHPRCTSFAYGTLTRSGRPSQIVRLDSSRRRDLCGDLHQVLQPRVRNGHNLGTDTVWATPRSLTTTWGISVDSCSSGY